MKKRMGGASISAIKPLAEPFMLYVDESAESNRAKRLIESAGITPYLTQGRVEPLQRKPLALFGGGAYQGIDQIRQLLLLLKFWSEQGLRQGIFREESPSNKSMRPIEV